MAKTMHSLLKAFNDGFEAIEKSKNEDTEENEQESTTLSTTPAIEENTQSQEDNVEEAHGDNRVK